MRKYLYASSVFLIALSLRLYPTFTSGLPFSTDAWSPIRNTELLMEYTPVHLDDNLVFDGYNSYWPANTLFGAVFSRVTGLKPITAMAVGIPLTGALTILVFYALVSKLSRNHRLAFIASVLLATAYPHALFTAGVTKETYANPLYMLSILVFWGPGKWRKALLFTISSLTLVLAHHLTALVAVAVLATMAVASSINCVRKGLSLNKSSLALVSILTIMAALYHWLYAYRGLKLTLTTTDWFNVASYEALAFALALYFVSRPHISSRARTLLTCFSAAATTYLFALVCVKEPIIPGAPILPSHYVLYASSFILASPLVVLGLGGIREMRGKGHTAPFFWLAAILGVEGYAAFGGLTIGLTLAYRTLNFLCLPLAFLCAVGLHRLYETRQKMHMQRLVSLAATGSLTIIVSLNLYSLYATVSLQERYMGYFWLYRTPEYEAAQWTATTALGKLVAGDVKVSYLLKDYFNVDVDVSQGLLYLVGKGSEPQMLFTYGQMLKNGYVIYGGCSADLPGNWLERVRGLNQMYCNGFVSIHGR